MYDKTMPSHQISYLKVGNELVLLRIKGLLR